MRVSSMVMSSSSMIIDMNQKNRLATHQWIDRKYMEDKNESTFNEIVGACKARHVYDLIGFNYDWNEEVICQFYSTLYVDGRGYVHWMTQGVQYVVSPSRLATFLFQDAEADDARDRLSCEPVLKDSELRFMHEDLQPKYLGTTHGMHNFYFTLNRMLRVTIAPKAGYTTSLVEHSRNVLARFRDGAADFSVMDLITQEIYSASLETRKVLPFAPYLMKMIEAETGLIFEKECKHQPLRPRVPRLTRPHHETIRRELATEKAARAEGAAPRASSFAPPLEAPRRRPSSPIASMLKSILNVCCFNAKENWENKKRIKKQVRRYKKDQRAQGHEVSPDGSECEPDGEPPVFEDPLAGYDWDDLAPPPAPAHEEQPAQDEQGEDEGHEEEEGDEEDDEDNDESTNDDE
ncbi:hypothetical protein QOZ80_3BG0267940 [Eleusine coracana subsp. coracana]|nr:hypothetical protein QOZ80_3BG0267940 [Eleusine coracana subsp. coracana]